MTTAAAEKRAATNSGTEPVREVVPPLKQRIVFVSGGMGGIGSAVCRRLARNGARVVAGCLPGYEKKDAWLAEATEKPGSWWPDWGAWLESLGGGRVKARTRLGNAKFKPIDPAPGRYVKHRIV